MGLLTQPSPKEPVPYRHSITRDIYLYLTDMSRLLSTLETVHHFVIGLMHCRSAFEFNETFDRSAETAVVL